MAADTFARRKFEWLDQIAKDARIGHLSFRLAYVIGSYINRKTGDAWPSRQTLSDNLGVTVRAVLSAVTQLEIAGYLEVTPNRGPGQTSLFKMVLPERNGDAGQERKRTSSHKRNDTSAQCITKAEACFQLTNDLSGSLVHAERKPNVILTGNVLPPEQLEEPIEELCERKTHPRKPQGKQKQNRPIPELWPTEKDLAWAVNYWRERGRPDLCERLDEIAARCREHHTAKGSMFADWSAAFRTWAMREVNYTKPPEDQSRVGGMSAARGIFMTLRSRK